MIKKNFHKIFAVSLLFIILTNIAVSYRAHAAADLEIVLGAAPIAPIDFGKASTGPYQKSIKKVVRITNKTGKKVEVVRRPLDSFMIWDTGLPPNTYILNPNESTEVLVIATPAETAGEFSTTWTLYAESGSGKFEEEFKIPFKIQFQTISWTVNQTPFIVSGDSGQNIQKFRKITLTNTGELPITGLSIELRGHGKDSFAFVSSLPTSLAPGESKDILLKFKPIGWSPIYRAQVVFSSELLKTHVVNLQDEHPDSFGLKFDRDTVDFGDVPPSSGPVAQEVVLENVTKTPLILTQPEPKLYHPFQIIFDKDQPGSKEHRLAPGQKLKVSVVYNPVKGTLGDGTENAGTNMMMYIKGKDANLDDEVPVFVGAIRVKAGKDGSLPSGCSAMPGAVPNSSVGVLFAGIMMAGFWFARRRLMA